MIEDITLKLKTILEIDNINLSIFNNGQLKINDLTIIVCRVIYHKEHNHPWKIWGKLSGCKFIRQLGNSIQCESKIHDISDFYDSTAMIIYKNNLLIFATNKLFGEEQNHDTRISLENNKILLTYTGFVKQYPVMLQRYLQLNNGLLKLSKETYMNEYYSVRTEKNWIKHNNLIHYSIDGKFIILDGTNNIQSIISPIMNLKFQYKNQLLFSQGTYPVKFGNEYLAVGHCKIAYKRNYNNLPFENFRNTLNNFKKYIMHGKYIYFMFLYTFVDNNLKRMSNAFIPKNEDYLLVFPISIINDDNKYIISYGEGDIRCKNLILEEIQIQTLLHNITNITSANFSFSLL